MAKTSRILGALGVAALLLMVPVSAMASGKDLFEAVADSDSQALTVLLAAGEKADAPDARAEMEGLTPLMIAARIGDVEAVTALLAAGADPFAQDDAGRTPAWYAAFGEQYETFSLLMALDGAEAIIDLPDTLTGNAMLHVAALSYEPRNVDILLSMGASQDLANGFGQTPADLCSVAVTPGCERLK